MGELYPDGQLFARLNDDLDDDGAEAAIVSEFLRALGAERTDLPDRLDALRAMFHSLTKDQRLMVFLDGAVRDSQVRMLLPGGAKSLVIVTETQPLGALAAHGPVTFVDLDPLEDAAALALFERVLGESAVARDRAAIEEIIQLCDQLPLALTVVAALLLRFPQRPAERLLRELRDERRRVRALSRDDDDVSVSMAFNLATRWLSDIARDCYHAAGSARGTCRASPARARSASRVSSIAGMSSRRMASWSQTTRPPSPTAPSVVGGGPVASIRWVSRMSNGAPRTLAIWPATPGHRRRGAARCRDVATPAPRCQRVAPAATPGPRDAH
ncbi:NB-ARC domain-containing protein [Amycolatopsis sp. YIM 10]|uniref:NB-ARC domain-containing protein n=1 Tax=Amycolatopsis sp. YIM 10 TaxID=2653857 RepID=UPI00128FE0BC|nr:NB-ARC domain-containing protein [Amycolatopsis sp. YIM 10]QFU86651.1 Regulatory protein AfsR [Amycolatopsis sp. YIM 10]